MRLLLLTLVGTGLTGVLVAGVVLSVRGAARGSPDHATPVVPDSVGLEGPAPFELMAGPSPMLPRLRAKQAVVDAVAREQIGLLDAVARLRAIDAEPGPAAPAGRVRSSEDTADAEYARWVITGVRVHSCWQYPELRVLADRLEAELACHLEQGALRLSQ